jgi:hypothetical protein
MAANLRGREARNRKRPLLEDVTKQRSEDRGNDFWTCADWDCIARSSEYYTP